jgi:hypothetical protein
MNTPRTMLQVATLAFPGYAMKDRAGKPQPKMEIST